MEVRAQDTRSPALAPPYEEWPPAPTGPLKHALNDGEPAAMDIDDLKNGSDRDVRQTSELSMDDIEAAQALEGLRSGPSIIVKAAWTPKLNFFTDTRQLRVTNSLTPKLESGLQSPNGSQQPEPLLSLFTSRHPLLSSTINGSLHAYSSSKSYSPSFKYGAEIVERLGSPVVNTVGTAGRISGVETGVRWWLQRSDLTLEDRSPKRRRTENVNGDVDVERGLTQTTSSPRSNRRLSEMSYSDTLPPYDTHTSPSYEEAALQGQATDESRPQTHPSWSSRLIRSTSGLGVAMSEESLESLKWALRCLGWANRHLTRLIISLRDAIEHSDSGSAQQPSPQSNASNSQPEDTSLASEGDAASARKRASYLQALTAEVIWIIQKVNNAVTEYAGSALPENARILVGRYLKSLRQSFQRSFAASSNNADSPRQGGTTRSETSAKKAILLAREALDKLAQVSGIVEGTIVSAEEWCERLGRGRSTRPSLHREEKRQYITSPSGSDMKMTGTDERSSAESPQYMDTETTSQQ